MYNLKCPMDDFKCSSKDKLVSYSSFLLTPHNSTVGLQYLTAMATIFSMSVEDDKAREEFPHYLQRKRSKSTNQYA